MRQIMKYVISAVETYYPSYSANFYMLIYKKKFDAHRLLLLLAFCSLGFVVKAQEPVYASFSTFDYQGCVPVKVQFSNNSTGGPISWFWDFGNGQTSIQPDPSCTYTIPGTYKVKMVVKNDVSTDSAFGDIVISGAKAEFSYTYTDVCTTPATINFAVPNPLNKVIYHWDFGDTHKAIIPNPANTYNHTGIYNVHLTTISPEGCTDSIVEPVQIGNGTVNFIAPAIACVNDSVTFTDNSVPHSLSSVWMINNIVAQQGGITFTYRFTKGGSYKIKLAESFGSCNDSKELSLQIVDKPIAAFSINGNTKTCAFPDTVQFVNNSVGAVAFKWYFGDGDSSVEENTTHIYKAGNFSPTLIAFNANGCTDTLVKTNALFFGGAIISILNLPDSGCIPHQVTFNTNIIAPEAIQSYLWKFGDGNTNVTALPSHTYTATGRYNVTLTIKTVSGCSNTVVIANAVSVGTHSIPDFTVSKTEVCGSDTIQFNGTANGPVSSWMWKFFGANEAFKQNTIYAYSDTGSKTVRLTVNNSGCLDSVVKRNIITIKPPTASFKQQYFCDDRTKVQLIDKSVDPKSWHWDFGDGSTSNVQSPPVHTYPLEGKYYVSLTTINAGCTDSFKDSIYIVNTPPVFTYVPADGRVCRKTGIGLGVVNPSYILDYLWDLQDGHTLFSDTSIVYSYYKIGTYYPSLIARYRNGCQDTLENPVPVTVTGPTADFATTLPAVCLKDTTFFVDKSVSDGEHDITTHVWTYSDDIIPETDNQEPYAHLYAGSGTFKASLAIADNIGCVDTAKYNVIVNALPQVSAGMDTYVCEGSNVQLQPSGALSYVWNTDASLSCLSCTNPLAAPLQDAAFIVAGTNANACVASDTVLITVVHPQTVKVNTASYEICAAKSVQLSAGGADLYAWSPAEGLNSATINNPVATPVVTTTYIVTGTDSKNCFSQTDSVTVIVHPNPEVTIVNNELVVEKGSRNVINTTGSNNIVKWYWYPSQGLSCTNCPQPVVEAEKTMNYNVIVYSDFGCTDTALINVHVLCNQSKIYIPAAFTPNGDGKNERFYVKSNIDNPIRSFVIYNRAGEMIFSKKGNITNYATEGWDGTYRGIQAPSGTYIYRVEVICNDAVVPFTGTVTLIR